MARRSNIVDIDLEKYVLYVLEATGEPVVICQSEAGRVHQLSSSYGGLENVPDNETIALIMLVHDAQENAYVFQKSSAIEKRINQLQVTWISQSNR